MTILRSLFATAAICSIVTLTGCASKEAVIIDQSPSTTAITTPSTSSTAASRTAADVTATGPAMTEVISADDGKADKTDASRSETKLETIFFDFDSFLLNSDARETLSRNASKLEMHRDLRVIIEGHADERGSDAYNLALSEKRAHAARRYVETLGVAPGRMETIGYGEEIPAVTSQGEDAWASNRRVEFVIVK